MTDEEPWHRCHECQVKLGAKTPKWGHRGITVMVGECPECGKKEATLVPNVDYDWPKKGEKAVWD